MKDHATPISPCPQCGKANDEAFNTINDAAPKPGDVTICIACGAWSVFGEGLTVRAATSGELTKIRRDPRTARAEAAVLESWAEADP